jgi:hypothetical protein
VDVASLPKISSVNRVIEQITQVLERGTWIHLANDFAMDLRQECIAEEVVVLA